MLNFVICDDSSPILIRLSKMLESIFIKHNINASVGLSTNNLTELFDYVENYNVDVLILDINLKAEFSGCDVAELIRKKNKSVYIIFYTGHLEYALVAYKYKTFDYLSKPLTQERLEETILRLVDDIHTSPSDFIKLNQNTVVKLSNINYIRKDGMKLVFCTITNNYEIYSSFNKMSNRLPKNFIRCHKSFIVNVNHVSTFNIKDNTIFLDNNEHCPIGTKYKNTFLEAFKYGDFTNPFDCASK